MEHVLFMIRCNDTNRRVRSFINVPQYTTEGEKGEFGGTENTWGQAKHTLKRITKC